VLTGYCNKGYSRLKLEKIILYKLPGGGRSTGYDLINE